MTIARFWLRGLGLMLAPPTCCLCGGPGREWQGREPGVVGRWHRLPLDLCEWCALTLPRPAQSWTRTWIPGGGCDQFAAFRYAAPVDRMIQQFKFNSDRTCGRVLATMLGGLRRASRDQPLPDVIVPVPMHAARYRERGLDHTGLLARWVADALSVPVAHGWLLRVRATPPQTGLTGAARRGNVQAAFALAVPRTPKRMPQPMRVALLDDVLTTGSTMAAATAALRSSAAVAEVEHWVLARAAR